MIATNKSEIFRKDPFSQSDRDPIGPHAGKGDRNRSDSTVMAKRWPKNVGQNVGKNPGKFRKTYH